MLPTKTPADMLITLTAQHARLTADLIAMTGRIGRRFTLIAEDMGCGALRDQERTLVDACADALALPRLAAHIRAVEASIALLRHVCA